MLPVTVPVMNTEVFMTLDYSTQSTSFPLNTFVSLFVLNGTFKTYVQVPPSYKGKWKTNHGPEDFFIFYFF